MASSAKLRSVDLEVGVRVIFVEGCLAPNWREFNIYMQPETNRQYLLPFRYRDFSVFWTGSFLSSMGTQFTTVAMAWQIYELTNSPLQIGLLGLARALPQMVLLLFGGLLADAMDRRGPRLIEVELPSGFR